MSKPSNTEYCIRLFIDTDYDASYLDDEKVYTPEERQRALFEIETCGTFGFIVESRPVNTCATCEHHADWEVIDACSGFVGTQDMLDVMAEHWAAQIPAGTRDVPVVAPDGLIEHVNIPKARARKRKGA